MTRTARRRKRNYTVKLHRNGTLTIPQIVRRQLGIKPGTVIEVTMRDDGFTGQILALERRQYSV